MQDPKAGAPEAAPAPDADDEAASPENRPAGGPRSGAGRRRGQPPRGSPPDILYHATTVARVEKAVARGVLEVRGGRSVFLSTREGQAWQVAHRLADDPAVLYVDVSRAQRAGCRFERNAQGLWQTAAIPKVFLLNLHAGFAEQVSAGGIPIWVGPEGPELALIQVQRRNGCTWEVAKGKLEPGEPPVEAAAREIREEMGYPLELEVFQSLGYVRYGFFTPEGDPRLKTLYMYLLRTPDRIEAFEPSIREGIRAVGWFSPRQAVRLVSHRSLRPLMRRVRRFLLDGDASEGD